RKITNRVTFSADGHKAQPFLLLDETDPRYSCNACDHRDEYRTLAQRVQQITRPRQYKRKKKPSKWLHFRLWRNRHSSGRDSHSLRIRIALLSLKSKMRKNNRQPLTRPSPPSTSR